MAAATMSDIPFASEIEPKPFLSFSLVRTIIDEPPKPAATTSTPSLSIPAIASYTGDIDPLDQAVNLPSNYAELNQASTVLPLHPLTHLRPPQTEPLAAQTRTLLLALFYALTTSPSSSSLAAHIASQRALSASLIASHSLALRYLDALNRITAAKKDLASYIDARAPGGLCTEAWRLAECEALVGPLEEAVGRARALRGDVERKGTGLGEGTGKGKEGTAPTGLAAAREAEREGKERTVPVGGLGMEMAKEFLERKGTGASAAGLSGMDGGGCGVGVTGDPSMEAMATLLRDAGLGLSDLAVRSDASGRDRAGHTMVREVGRVVGEVENGEDGEDVEMDGLEAAEEGVSKAGESKKREANGPSQNKGKRNKRAQAFGDMLD